MAQVTRSHSQEAPIAEMIAIIKSRIPASPKEFLKSFRHRQSRYVCDFAFAEIRKKLKLQYPTVTARLHVAIDEKVTISLK